MDGFADVLERGVAQNLRLACLGGGRDIHKKDAESGADAAVSEVARPTTGPPVLFNRRASSLKVRRRSGLRRSLRTPRTYSTSSDVISQSLVARSIICRLTSCAA